MQILENVYVVSTEFPAMEAKGRALSETTSLLLMQSDSSDRSTTLQNFHESNGGLRIFI